jgi:hypothetical protein
MTNACGAPSAQAAEEVFSDKHCVNPAVDILLPYF